MEDMKRVLIITGTLNFGGVERLIVDTAKNLLKKGNYQPIILNLSDEGELINELKNSGIEYVSLGQNHLRKNIIETLFKTRKLIKTCRPDIIHTHQFASDFYGSLGATGLNIPIIFHLHNIQLESLLQKIIRFILNKYFVNAFITTTKEETSFLKRALPSAKIFLLYNAIDPQNLRLPEKFNEINYKGRFSISKDNLIIGAIGRLAWEKGYDLLLLAFKQVLERTPNAFLILVGDGPEEKNLKSLARNLGITERIIFTGYRTDIPSLLSIFDIFVISSRTESFSLAALEAMLMSVPVLITDRLSSKNIFAPAVLIAPLSVEGLRGEMISLLKDEKKRKMLGARGKKLVKCQFAMDGYIAKLQKIYDEIIKSQKH